VVFQKHQHFLSSGTCASFSILFKGTKFKKKIRKKHCNIVQEKEKKGSEPKIYLNLTHKNIATNWFYVDWHGLIEEF
jgi:hypothetical protein